MLKYKYSLNSSSLNEELNLGDLYVSPDLSFISGTTSDLSSVSLGGTIWVRSPYYPEDLPAQVTSKEIVKRNGYILAPLNLDIHVSYCVEEEYPMRYVEYNGNTYYSTVEESGSNNVVFTIDGIDYTVGKDDANIIINGVVYIENDSLTVDGIKYNAIINNNGELSVTDSSGLPFIYGDSWDVSNVSSDSTFVSKLYIGNNEKTNIETKSVTYYGWMAYIQYNGNKYYIDYFEPLYTASSGCGVTINGVQYVCDALEGDDVNVYDIDQYKKDDNGKSFMIVNSEKCIINFEPCEIQSSGMICIETVDNYLPILKYDLITIKSSDYSSELKIMYGDGPGYVYYNGKRYDVQEGLCDSVELGGEEFMLSYLDEEVNGLRHAFTEMDDGTLMYFAVSSETRSVNNENVVVPIAKKVLYVDGEYKDSYTFKKTNVESDNVGYVKSEWVDVIECAGVQIGSYRAKVQHMEVYTEYETQIETDASYDYITINFQPEYLFKVVNTIGSNRFVCVPYVDKFIYGNSASYEISLDILGSIVGKQFVVQKRLDMFGSRDLYFDTWLNDAYNVGGGTSTYELSNITENITLIGKSPYFSIPVKMSNDANYMAEYEDIIMKQYYPLEEEKSINKLVDMEKDMYTPMDVYRLQNSDEYEINSINEITFNLHFRTRDLDTWKIIEDEGKYKISNDDFTLVSVSGNIFEGGGVDATSGDTVIDSLRVRTNGYVNAPFVLSNSANTDYCFYVFKYMLDGSYDYNYNDAFHKSQVGIIGPLENIDIDNTDFKYRIVVRKRDNTAISASTVNNIPLIYRKEYNNIPLTANYQFCNYFITDYWPYYRYSHKPNGVNLYLDLRDGQYVYDSTNHTLDENTGVTGTYIYGELYPPFKLRSEKTFKLYRRSTNSNEWYEVATDGVNSYTEVERFSPEYYYKVNFTETVGDDDYLECVTYQDRAGVTIDCPYNGARFGELVSNSDLLGFLYFTTDDVEKSREKLQKSFLRLTFFDSKNPEKQNMLGTSTLYFDCNRYFDVLDRYYEKLDDKKVHYEEVYKSRQPDRVGTNTGYDRINWNENNMPTVLTECFNVSTPQPNAHDLMDSLMVGDSRFKIDSRITLNDMNQKNGYSEGFYAYILKEFADKKEPKTIYMKVEFFHAGVGYKIPMTIPTKEGEDGYDAIDKEGWTEEVYNEFINGYELSSVFDRLYIPITIQYDRKRKKFIYSVSETNNYRGTIVQEDVESGKTNLEFNLFELKVKSQ